MRAPVLANKQVIYSRLFALAWSEFDFFFIICETRRLFLVTTVMHAGEGR